MYQVLVVDDEAIERIALTRRIRKHFGDSCVIREAKNGQEAVRLFREKSAQIAILDIAMPGMNGVEAAEEIRRMDQDCSIVFLTAYDDFAYTRRAIIVRALDYLLKPCNEDELTAVIEEAMRLADIRRRRSPEVSEDFADVKAGAAECAAASFAVGAESGGYGSPLGRELPKGQDTDPEGAPGVQTGELRMKQVAEAMRQYICDNFMTDISMQAAARAMNYSDVYFCRLFKQCFDQNFTSYLAQFRINEAKKLLMDLSVNVKDAGMSVGYADSNYFAKVFKRLTGMIPSEFRNSQNAQKEIR